VLCNHVPSVPEATRSLGVVKRNFYRSYHPLREEADALRKTGSDALDIVPGMPERPGTSRRDPIAVIDLGSNSGRVMVFERDASNHLRLLAGSRAPLRLVQDVDGRAQLSEATMARTMEALRDFQAIATSVGAKRIVAVATAAMRDARNGGLFAQRVQRELGIQIETIGELAEARYGFAGAVRGLAVSNGLLFDLGGGSMQVTRFARRQLVEAVSLPIGALRSSNQQTNPAPARPYPEPPG
jgi:exopolyphosphatase/pppGpp-phosphohydrolase